MDDDMKKIMQGVATLLSDLHNKVRHDSMLQTRVRQDMLPSQLPRKAIKTNLQDETLFADYLYQPETDKQVATTERGSEKIPTVMDKKLH